MEFVAEKTDPELLQLLEQSAKRKLSRHEVEQQRVSFVYSVMYGRTGMTRERVEELLDHQAEAT